MKYFHISNGLRGCYMPDNAYTIAVKTRRDLKAAIENEARDMRDAGYRGASVRAVATLAAEAWASTSIYDCVMSLAPPHSLSNYCYGLFVSPATRKDFLENQND